MSRARGGREGRFELVGWRMAHPRSDETVRWESGGRWIAVTLVDAGRARIDASFQPRQELSSFAEAVALAQRWRDDRDVIA